MIQLKRTTTDNIDFLQLVELLDADLLKIDGKDQLFYSKFNRVETIRYVVVAYEEGLPIACGAMREYDSITMEIKRMYTSPCSRGKGIAGQIVTELEKWAVELSYDKCILDTGKRQPAAISLYIRQGYSIISSYGQYIGDNNSVCFEKQLAKDF